VAKPDRARRFRRLAPEGTTGDLFAHFGISADPPPLPVDPPTTDAVACPACGWWRADATTAPCWMCGAKRVAG
jgi:hypothetical protein